MVGGGVMGAATLYNLARHGCTDVVLIEREAIASGSTSKAAGGFRAQFSDELNIRIALRAIDHLARFSDEVGTEIDFRRNGYLFLLDDDGMESFRPSVMLQNSLGVASRLIEVEEVEGMVPGVRTDDLAGAAYCATDGQATPEAVTLGYAAAARAMGARLVTGCRVRSLDVEDGRITGVTTDLGNVSTRRVVLAAGIWSVDLAAAAGLSLPVRPEKRHVWLSGPDPMPRHLPLTIDFATGFYFHREGERLLMGGPHQTVEAFAADAVDRLPLAESLGVTPAWWGYYGMSPDHNAIVGAAADPAGLMYACGFSGHGFQQGPVVGEYLAALCLDEAPPLDLSAMTVERFASGAVRPEANVV